MPFGNVLSVDIRSPSLSGKKVYAIVRFEATSEAAKAKESLNGTRFLFSKISVDLRQELREEVGKIHARCVCINIPAPGKELYAGYNTKREARDVVRVANGVDYKGYIIGAHLHAKTPRIGEHTVRFEGFPPGGKEEDVATFNDGKGFDGYAVSTRALYKSFDEAKDKLRYIIGKHGKIIRMYISRGPPVDSRLLGTIEFADEASAITACKKFNARSFEFLGNGKIFLSQTYSIVYRVPSFVFKVISHEVRLLAKFAISQPGSSICFKNKSEFQVELVIEANNLDRLRVLKNLLEPMISGSILTKDGKPIWHDFFSTPTGKATVGEIGRDLNTYIRVHGITGCLKFWGNAQCVEQAKERVVNKINTLLEKKSFTLPLRGKLLMNILFNKMDALFDELGKDTIKLDLEKNNIVVYGDEDQFGEVIKKLSSYGSSPDKGKGDGCDNDACPVCLDNIVDEAVLCCGHKYCKQCLIVYLKSASENRTFPLKCLGNFNNCTELLPLSLCKGLLQKERFKQLIDASFSSYIQKHPDEFHYCPSPDCPQVYRDVSDPLLHCPTCLVMICTSCHEFYHEGVPCRLSNEENDRLFKEWLEANNVKPCPKCSSNIEKVSGCNHVLCTNCSTHMCWECMQAFESSPLVYKHMTDVHKGFGLQNNELV